MVFTFDDFELNEATFELRHDRRRVDIQPKSLVLLIHLVKNRSRSVSKSELFAALWPSAKVGPTSLPKAVYGARLALGLGRSGETAIRTVRGRGYRFALPVREGGGAALEERAEEAALASERPAATPVRPIDAAGAIAVAARVGMYLAELAPDRARALIIVLPPIAPVA